MLIRFKSRVRSQKRQNVVKRRLQNANAGFTQKEVDFSPPLFCRLPRRKENRRFPFLHLLKEISTQFGPTDARGSRTPPPLQELTVQERFTWSDAKNASKIVDKCKSSLDFRSKSRRKTQKNEPFGRRRLPFASRIKV